METLVRERIRYLVEHGELYPGEPVPRLLRWVVFLLLVNLTIGVIDILVK